MGHIVCCKINNGVTGVVADCNKDILSGFKEILIAPLCHILGIIIDPAPDVLISDIDMDDNVPVTVPPGDAEHLFYEFETRDQGASFAFDHQFDPETLVTTYNETVLAEIQAKNALSEYAMDQLFGKEIVVIGQEAGEDGDFLMSGREGGLYLTQMTGGTGQKKTDTNHTILTITGELDKRFLRIFDTSAVTTRALIDSIKA